MEAGRPTAGGEVVPQYQFELHDEEMEQKDQIPRTAYICGGCGKDVKLDKDSNIRCMYCGHRIFYKKRDRKLLQYNAR